MNHHGTRRLPARLKPDVKPASRLFTKWVAELQDCRFGQLHPDHPDAPTPREMKIWERKIWQTIINYTLGEAATWVEEEEKKQFIPNVELPVVPKKKVVRYRRQRK
jgi:hypothetical protein